MSEVNITPFQVIYDRFLGKITDDMYLELTEEDTKKDLETMLMNSMGGFQFPRFPLFNYDKSLLILNDEGVVIGKGAFNSSLKHEEIDILSNLMLIEWFSRQLASVENTRMKYSGSDFKFTSQANHIDKLIKLKDNYILVNKREQRMYKRRRVDAYGNVETNWSGLAGGVIDGSRK